MDVLNVSAVSNGCGVKTIQGLTMNVIEEGASVDVRLVFDGGFASVGCLITGDEVADTIRWLVRHQGFVKDPPALQCTCGSPMADWYVRHHVGCRVRMGR